MRRKATVGKMSLRQPEFSHYGTIDRILEPWGLAGHNLNHCSKQISFMSTFSSGNVFGVGLDRKGNFFKLMPFFVSISQGFCLFIGLLSHQFQGL